MAELSTKQDSTAWGDVHVYVSEPGADGAMGTDWVDLGSIDENALSIATTEGTVYTLKDINGKVLDKLRLEPEIAVNFTLLKPSDMTVSKFWDVSETGTGEDRKLWVKSMVQTANKSFKFSNPKAIGSRTFEAPVASLNMTPGYDAAKGWTAACTAEILNTGKEGWFGFGVVKAAVQGFSAPMAAPSGGTPVK